MRGVIRNRERAAQLRDFSGLRFGTITPTDIDGFLEFEDVLFVWIEIKLVGVDLPRGQKIALVRSCNAIHGTENDKGIKRIGIVLVTEHNTPIGQDIDVAETNVVRCWYGKEWQEPKQPTTCKQAIEKMLECKEKTE